VASQGWSGATAAAPAAPKPAPAKPKALKKGFFDAKPKKKKDVRNTPEPYDGVKYDADGIEEIPTLVGKKYANVKDAHIPDFMRVEPDEEAKKLGEVKQKLVDALKPTPELMKGVAADENLMAGFDDPEVMAAVDDVAKHPENIKKYQNNPKARTPKPPGCRKITDGTPRPNFRAQLGRLTHGGSC